MDLYGNMLGGMPIIILPPIKKQARTHKKKRINKKWLKRYGYKQISVESKGWKMKADTDGNVEFIK